MLEWGMGHGPRCTEFAEVKVHSPTPPHKGEGLDAAAIAPCRRGLRLDAKVKCRKQSSQNRSTSDARDAAPALDEPVELEASAKLEASAIAEWREGRKVRRISPSPLWGGVGEGFLPNQTLTA